MGKKPRRKSRNQNRVAPWQSQSHLALAANASREAAQRGHYADPGLGAARGVEPHEERRDEEPIVVVILPEPALLGERGHLPRDGGELGVVAVLDADQEVLDVHRRTRHRAAARPPAARREEEEEAEQERPAVPATAALHTGSDQVVDWW